uniref:Disease resistance protein Roq1-like winged-helix domain-containing protein n=1 Tax=Glycine max TaxID=3847 RepID=A0A0R0HBW7_SOYBN
MAAKSKTYQDTADTRRGAKSALVPMAARKATSADTVDIVDTKQENLPKCSEEGGFSTRARPGENRNITDVLRISFNELDDIDKEVFLVIACFFYDGYKEQYVKEILDFRGLYPEYGLQVLVDKSFIVIHEGCIEMHGLLRDLGRCIAQEKLWHRKDLYKVLSHNKAKVYLEAIVIEYHFPQTMMRVDALSKMSHLKLLTLQFVKFSGSLNYLSDELGYLNWFEYPFDCLPPSFQPDKLVELILRCNSIKQLWEGTKHLPNLRRLNLSHSKNLFEMGNLGESLNLESLYLEGCIQIKHIDPSIGILRKLIFVNLKDCKSLTKLPHFGEDFSLEILYLEGCMQLRWIDPSIDHLRKLSVLNLKDCINLVSLPNSLLGHISFEFLSLSSYSKLYNIQLLDESRDVENLKKLEIGEAPIHSQSSSSYLKAHDDFVSCLFPSSPIFQSMHQLDLSLCNLLQIPDAIGNL